MTGGRASLKSTTAHDFIVRLTFEQGHGVLFTRYTMTSAEKSIIPEFKITISRLGLEKHFHVTKNVITNKETGSFIYFSGIKTSSGDQTANLKSIAGITTWVIEEGEDFNDEKAFDSIDDSIRTLDKQNRIIWIQNPSTKEHFIYKRWIENNNKQTTIGEYNVTVSDEEDVEHIHTWYKIAVKFLSEGWLKKAENARINNPKWYYHNYVGGWLEKAEGVIYENWIEGDFNDSLPYAYGQDFGFAVDPDTLIKVAIDEKSKRIYAKELMYSNKQSTDVIISRNKELVDRSGDLIVADNSDSRLIRDMQDSGINVIPCTKGADSIRTGIKLIQGYTIVVDPSSHNMKKELNNYAWNDKKSETPNDNYNHLLDALRYVVRKLLSGNNIEITWN